MEDIKLKIQEWIEIGMPYLEGVLIFNSIRNRRRNFDSVLNSSYKIDNHKKLLWLICQAIGNEKLYQLNVNSIGAAALETQKEAKKEIDFQKAINAVIADKEHTFKTQFEDLPENLQTLVIRKGVLYNEFDKLKNQLFSGTENTENEIEKRGDLIAQMHTTMDEIKEIHLILNQFDANPELTVKPVEPEKSTSEMSEAEIKLELIKVRKNLGRQLVASVDSVKEKIRAKNAAAAIVSQDRIVELENSLDALQPKE